MELESIEEIHGINEYSPTHFTVLFLVSIWRIFLTMVWTVGVRPKSHQ